MGRAPVCHSRRVTLPGGTEAEGARLSSVVVVDGRRRVRARVAEPVVPPGDGCPVVAFGHGFFQRPALYDSLLAAMAARGYFVVAPDTETGPWPSHRRLADDLWRVAGWARDRRVGWRRRGDRAGRALDGRRGGPARGVPACPELDAVVTLAALRTRPPARLEAIAAPTPVRRGVEGPHRPAGADPGAVRGDAGVGRQWALIRGGYHCGFLDGARWRDAGCDQGDLSAAGAAGDHRAGGRRLARRAVPWGCVQRSGPVWTLEGRAVRAGDPACARLSPAARRGTLADPPRRADLAVTPLLPGSRALPGLWTTRGPVGGHLYD